MMPFQLLLQSAFDDRAVPDKGAWNSSIQFMEMAVRERLEDTKVGYGAQLGESRAGRDPSRFECFDCEPRPNLNILLLGDPQRPRLFYDPAAVRSLPLFTTPSFEESTTPMK